MTFYGLFWVVLSLLMLVALIRVASRPTRTVVDAVLSDDPSTMRRMDELYDEATAAFPALKPSRALMRLYDQYGVTLRLSRATFGDPSYRSIRKLLVRDRILIARRSMLEHQKEFEEEFGGITLPAAR